jgi:hypothetical protein
MSMVDSVGGEALHCRFPIADDKGLVSRSGFNPDLMIDCHAGRPHERNAAHVIVGIARPAAFKWSAPRQVFLDWPFIEQTHEKQGRGRWI